MAKNLIRSTTVGTVSALALAVAGHATAFSFDAGPTKVSISGYIKGDMIYDASENLGETLGSRNINTGAKENNEVEGHFKAHARQSRLRIATSTPAEQGGNVTTLIEGDFFGAGGNEAVSNSHGFRLRHVWAEWNGIGVGQTWSNFMPLVALPPTLDFAGPSGYVFNRQAQLRYTLKTGSGALSVALENPEAQLVGSTDNKDPLPDITARYVGKLGNLNYSASGVVNFLEVDDGINDDSTTGYAVMLAASNKFNTGTTVGGNVGYFDGANRYLWQGGGGGFKNAFVNASGQVKTVGELALMAYVDQALTDKTNAALVIGYAKLDDDTVAIGKGAAEKFTSVHANLRYKPVKAVTFGVELQWAEREEFNGDDGDATRIQVSGQYAF